MGNSAFAAVALRLFGSLLDDLDGGFRIGISLLRSSVGDVTEQQVLVIGSDLVYLALSPAAKANGLGHCVLRQVLQCAEFLSSPCSEVHGMEV